MNKILVLIGFSLLAVLIQVTVGPWLSIADIRPDFILILVMLVGIKYGRVPGETYGFVFGMIVDFIGIGSFLGLSALAKTFAGFLAGFLKGRRTRLNSFTFYLFSGLIIFIHYAIFYLINFHSADHSIQFTAVRYIIPDAVYTLVIFIIFDYLSSLDNV